MMASLMGTPAVSLMIDPYRLGIATMSNPQVGTIKKHRQLAEVYCITFLGFLGPSPRPHVKYELLFALLESGDVDDDLAALKKDMLGSSKKSGELPPGRSNSSSAVSSGMSVKELEIEAELNELRRKARDL